ncbi:MFS transporter [Chryseosolibacter indicus]|uniref:MFS transporter n=1 Tax=Chryseosolibacter indicus TaxID=2782351 RepID=A0ABS5VXV3_9BACT|nr:MFS transporter [Chryseosolibacter indicus]MBT1706239.1 MFS transporter [Chryseosolibacter indicus]
MKTLKQNHVAISTLLAFALIPLSGFATDVYLPSFPAMASFFGTSRGDIQLTLIVFVVSNGVSQLFVGTFLDSFGRYRLSLVSLIIFALSSLVITLTNNIGVLISMRIIQGITAAVIVVGKRAFFIDLYSGSRLKHYTSLFSIIWATAPIIAPFLGGFLQTYFGWQSNFYFLGIVTLIILTMEIVYSGETLKTPQPLQPKQVLSVYASRLATPDFTVSLIILGIAFSNVIVFNMASPFIIEHVFHGSAVIIGNASLFSGLAVLLGGLLSKSFIDRSIFAKMMLIGPFLLGVSFLMMVFMVLFPSLILMMSMVLLLHIGSGFTFNTFYTYALGRFSSNAGIASGITGGGAYVITSTVSYALTSTLEVHDPLTLGASYCISAALTSITFILFSRARKRSITLQASAEPAM